MNILNALVTMLVIIGIVGLGWIVIAGLTWLYGKIENWILRRRISDKIKKEVEESRMERDTIKEEARKKYAGTGNIETEQVLERIRTPTGIDVPMPSDFREEIGSTKKKLRRIE